MSILEKRFGVVAIENGFITKDQLHKALITQVDENIDGKTHQLIGNILMDLGYINSKEVSKVFLSLKGE